jgi:ferric-dicitrate binding protein FerR (iron transport regulator)
MGASNPLFIFNSYTAAVVTKVIQDVKHKSGDDDWVQTKPLTQLKNNDLLSTGVKSVAVLKFVDGSILRVREKSTIVIYADKKERGLIKNTKLENGKILFDVNKQSDDDKFIITTPTAVATVRGTAGLVETLEDGSTLVFVERGVVDVESTGENRDTKTLEAGKVSIVKSDGTILLSDANEEQRANYLSSNKTNEKSIQIQTNRGNFRIYYLDSE